MRAAVYHSNRDVRIEERPVPRIGPGEVLLRVEASGICGSDVLEWYRIRRAPLVLGHEVAGVVEEVGPGVTAFAPGQRIATTHHVPCNACRLCLSGRHSLCDTLRSTHFDPGGMAEFVRLPAENVERGTFLVPDGVGSVAASFVEPLACTVRAQRLAGIGPGRSVAVLGSGLSGILQVQLARALGAGPIVATDVHPFRLAAAARLGADVVVDAREDVPAAVRRATGGLGADAVLVCTGAAAAVAQAFRCASRGGTVLLFALLPPGEVQPVPLGDLWQEGVTVTSSYAGPPADMRVALDLIAAGRVDVLGTVTHRLPLEEAAEGFRLTAEAGASLKVILEP
ncbi:MAG TPA: zinc-binding dehydrogenase [Candidatus Polarisedimenticolaceae bacterium]|nr:zinc-binding dehydrogenase [Candidatus Polarisedimenticolaceae bacterium]